jgi:AmmeMemoRadiSam system protein B/AmmeMemoRadiSam system protein A
MLPVSWISTTQAVMTATTAPQVRKSVVAGAFYPGAAAELAAAVNKHMTAAEAGAQEARAKGAPVPKAIIAPHAGFVYSGPIAGSAYARIAPAADRIRRVVLLGPSHRVGFRGVAVPTVDAFETPLGRVPLDRAAIDSIAKLPGVQMRDDAHAMEHSLEVHLPFLQRIFPQFSLVPIVVGDAGATEVAAVIEALWGGPETVIIVSSDLSHYENYETAQRMDGETVRAIEALAVNGISEPGACGRRPIRGLLEVARRRGMQAKCIDLRNSGDTAGPRSRVVGYASVVFEEGATGEALLDAGTRNTLLKLARQVVREGADGTLQGEPKVTLQQPNPVLTAIRASFVTLNAAGRLRGCIGSLQAHKPLAQDVASNAYKSAFADPRFPKVTLAEVDGLETKISILSTPAEVRFESEQDLVRILRPGIDGMILADGPRRGTFLPQVWEQIPEPAEFLRRLKAKAGLPMDHWSPTMQAWRYGTETFSESGA